MILLTTFFMNALCALVPCPPQFPGPEIDSASLLGFRDGVRRLRNINNGSSDSDGNDVALNILDTTPRVDTQYGTIEGYFMKTVGGRDIYAFEGIPFAEPPVGSLRFEVNEKKLTLFLPHISDMGFQVVRGMEQVLQESPFALLICNLFSLLGRECKNGGTWMNILFSFFGG